MEVLPATPIGATRSQRLGRLVASDSAAVRDLFRAFRWHTIGRQHAGRMALRLSRADQRLGEHDDWKVAVAECMDAAIVGHDPPPPIVCAAATRIIGALSPRLFTRGQNGHSPHSRWRTLQEAKQEGQGHWATDPLDGFCEASNSLSCIPTRNHRVMAEERTSNCSSTGVVVFGDPAPAFCSKRPPMALP